MVQSSVESNLTKIPVRGGHLADVADAMRIPGLTLLRFALAESKHQPGRGNISWCCVVKAYPADHIPRYV